MLLPDVPSNVLHQAVKLGIDPYSESNEPAKAPSEVVKDRIQFMIRSSAPVTHPMGNRRYEEWVFLVDENRVKRIHLIQCESCEDKKRVMVVDVCGYCEGAGCPACQNRGEKQVMIPCPDCAP